MAVTAADVSTWGKFPLPTGDELTALDLVIAAVTDHVTAHYVVDDPLSDRQSLAITMQSARLWRRRDTPEGVVAFEDLGAIRVSRMDPDVETMLTPLWNFA